MTLSTVTPRARHPHHCRRLASRSSPPLSSLLPFFPVQGDDFYLLTPFIITHTHTLATSRQLTIQSLVLIFFTKVLPHRCMPDESVSLQISLCFRFYPPSFFSLLLPFLMRPTRPIGYCRIHPFPLHIFHCADTKILSSDVNQPMTLHALDCRWSEFCACRLNNDEM